MTDALSKSKEDYKVLNGSKKNQDCFLSDNIIHCKKYFPYIFLFKTEKMDLKKEVVSVVTNEEII